MSKPDGWKTYAENSDNLSQKMVEVINDKSKTIDEVVEKIEKIHNDIKFKSFGKTTVYKVTFGYRKISTDIPIN